MVQIKKSYHKICILDSKKSEVQVVVDSRYHAIMEVYQYCELLFCIPKDSFLLGSQLDSFSLMGIKEGI
jgi:hypothetical protein